MNSDELVNRFESLEKRHQEQIERNEAQEEEIKSLKSKLEKIENRGKFFQRMFTPRKLAFSIVGVLCMYAFITVAVTLTTTVPHTFTSGSPISASKVNENFATIFTNFTALKTAVDAIEASLTDALTSSNIAKDAITSSEIAANAVTASKIATGAVTSSSILDGSISNADISSSAAIDPTKIASSVFASYATDAGQVIANNTATIVDFEDQVSDANSAVTTGSNWKFTAPSGGVYLVTGHLAWGSSNVWGLNEVISARLFKNGVEITNLGDNRLPLGILYPSQNFTYPVSLSQGDYIDVRARQSSGFNIALHTSTNYIHIMKVSN